MSLSRKSLHYWCDCVIILGAYFVVCCLYIVFGEQDLLFYFVFGEQDLLFYF